jgi:transposase
MRKRSTVTAPKWTVGLDLGDRRSRACVIGDEGRPLEEVALASTAEGIAELLSKRERCRVVMEAGGHSPWVSRLVRKLGHEAVVANPRKLRLITESDSKSDRLDARTLAQLGHANLGLLHVVHHRSAQAQQDLAVVRARDALVRCRTLTINHVRSEVKAVGARLPSCSSEAFARKVAEHLPAELRAVLEPMLEAIARMTETIRAYEGQIEALCERHPATKLLRQVEGVGPITSLTYVLTLDDPRRFRRSRQVGAFLGLRPRRDQSGGSDPQLRITKAGDKTVRRLLVGSAQYILGRFGPDTALRRFGQALASRGGKNAKKRAVVAVARKLAVLLHRLWVTGEEYEPLRAARAVAETPARAS